MDQKPIKDRGVKEINEAGKIARFYGFKPIISLNVKKQDFELTKDLCQALHPAEKAALMRMYFDEKMMSGPQPGMFYIEKSHKSSRLESSLVCLGSSKSTCECLSIAAGISILNELGYKNLSVEINSIGDKESMAEFQRKLTVFARKNINNFSADLRQAVKKDLLAVFREKGDYESFQAKCPKAIDFLSEPSRMHFKEIIEFLEIMKIPYEINCRLVSDFDIGGETVFSIKSESGLPAQAGEELASGFRFSRLAKKIGCKKDLLATILNIFAKSKKSLKRVRAKTVKPQFYLVQFGPEAKLKSFLVLQELFKAGVSVIHSIAKDKLGSRIGIAEFSDAPYIILIGQKEALENSAVIRNSLTRAQEIVPIPEIAARAKALMAEHFA